MMISRRETTVTPQITINTPPITPIHHHHHTKPLPTTTTTTTNNNNNNTTPPPPSTKDLYQLAQQSNWTTFLHRLSTHPHETKSFGGYTYYQREQGTPLHMACLNHAPYSVIKSILDIHPDATMARTRHGNLPLHVACDAGCDLDIIQLLLEYDGMDGSTSSSRNWRQFMDCGLNTPIDFLWGRCCAYNTIDPSVACVFQDGDEEEEEEYVDLSGALGEFWIKAVLLLDVDHRGRVAALSSSSSSPSVYSPLLAIRAAVALGLLSRQKDTTTAPTPQDSKFWSNIEKLGRTPHSKRFGTSAFLAMISHYQSTEHPFFRRWDCGLHALVDLTCLILRKTLRHASSSTEKGRCLLHLVLEDGWTWWNHHDDDDDDDEYSNVVEVVMKKEPEMLFMRDDGKTRLFPFMLAATKEAMESSSEKVDDLDHLNTIFELLKAAPDVVFC